MKDARFLAAEFFAGIGLVRAAISEHFRVVFANDIDPRKFAIYRDNFSPASEFVLRDIALLKADDIPTVHLATASFPCTDLSLAGNRLGLAGSRSGTLWEFMRLIEEMNERRPPMILLENVPGFATSRRGRDLEAAVAKLNSLGYVVDLVVADARWFVPQSRQRLFILGVSESNSHSPVGDWEPSPIRPPWVLEFVEKHPAFKMRPFQLGLPPHRLVTLSEVVERLNHRSKCWWNRSSVTAFERSLSPLQRERLDAIRTAKRLSWATAYRRTRQGVAVWEIRADAIAGCLRTTGGGSSRQAIVEAGRGNLRIRWMTAREYARLQGAPDLMLDSRRENEAKFALGDAVCVPVVRWLINECMSRLDPEGIREIAAEH